MGIDKMLRLIIVILSLLATFMCIESGGAILDWLYSTKAYRIIYIIGETIADGTLTNMAFLVCALLCFCVSFRWLCFKKASFKRGVLWVALFSLIVQCDDTLFADIFLPCITYKHLWSLMLIILLGLDALKLLKSITKRSKAVKNEAPQPSDKKLLHIDETDVEDLLGREKEAEVLVSYVMENINTTGTIGVAVTGEWGTGKSVFLNYLGREFRKRNIFPISFDPWMDKSTDVQADFFRLLTNEIKKEKDFELTSALEDYMESLKISTANNWFSLVLMTVGYLFSTKTNSVAERRLRLREAMIKRDTPMVVFIDDCDRLYSESLKDTFSLIRTTADLPNLVIVAAYDTVRVDEILKKDGGKCFLKKMFNLTHPLQRMSEQTAKGFLLNHIIKIHKLPVRGSEILFDHIDLTHFLPTLRECKSYLNMVQEDYIPYMTVADNDALVWSKWLLLELLKYVDRYTYQRLKENPQALLEIKKEREIIDESYVLKKETGLSDDIFCLVKAIFSESFLKTYMFDIRVPEMYPLYFSAEFPETYLTEEYYKEIVNVPLDNRIKVLCSLLKEPNTNIKQLVAEQIYREMDDCMALGLLVDMLEAYVMNMEGQTINDLTRRTVYQKYVRALEEHPFLGSLADGIIDYELDIEAPDIKVHESVSEYIQATPHTFAVLAVMADVMKHKSVEAYAGVDEFFIGKLCAYASEPDINYEDIGWICGDCVTPDLYGKFLKNFLDNHFLDLLPMTLTFNHDDGEPYIVSRHDGLKALFDTYENYRRYIERWQKEQRFDAAILKQHCELVFFSGILNQHNANHFSQHLYPALKQFDRTTLYRAPFSSVRIKKDFWENKSRIKQENNYFIVMDAN